MPNVIMPALGMDQATGTIVRWIKREGDAVTKGEPIMEIETDKAVVEVEADASGVLANVTAVEGAEIPVGRVIAQIVEASSSESPVASSEPTRTQLTTRNPELETTRVLASPRARRLAAERGIDLGAVRGSGPEGAVLAVDLPSAAPAATPAPSRELEPATLSAALPALVGHPEEIAAPTEPLAQEFLAVTSPPEFGEGPGVGAAPTQPSTDEPPGPAPSPQPSTAVSRTWRIMAERMTAAWTTIPHFALVREVDATSLRDMRSRIAAASAKRGPGPAPTYTDLLVKLVAAAIRRQPRINVSWHDDSLEQHSEVNVGIAVATDEGLVVPVVQAADGLSVGEIAGRRQELVERATAGKLTPADISGGTFTITNLGMYGVDAFAAIINPPQAAILAVGRIADRVLAVDGQPAVRPTMIVTLSCDHRAVDGARAAQFLDELVGLIEEPWGLLV